MGGSGRNPIAFRDGLDSRDGVFAKKKKLPSEDAVASFTAVVRNTAEFGTIIGMSVSDAWAKLQAFTRPRCIQALRCLHRILCDVKRLL